MRQFHETLTRDERQSIGRRWGPRETFPEVGKQAAMAPRINSLPTLMGLALLLTLSLVWIGGHVEPVTADIAQSHELERELDQLGWVSVGKPRSLPHGVGGLRASRAFELAFSPRTLSCGAVTEANARRALEFVDQELARYRPAFIQAIGLRRVVLCQGLREAGRPVPSMPNIAHSLLLDADLSPEFAGRLLHHELFHFADFADDRSVKLDTGWAGLNPAQAYGAGGHVERAAGSAAWTEEPPGFVSGYAMSALEEDKAEVYSFCMTQPVRVRRRMVYDPLLRQKVYHLQRQLSSFSESPLEHWL